MGILICCVIIIFFFLVLLPINGRSKGKILIAGEEGACRMLHNLAKKAGYEDQIGVVSKATAAERFIEERNPRLVLTGYYLSDGFFGPELTEFCNGRGVKVIVVLPARVIAPETRNVLADIETFEHVSIFNERQTRNIIWAIKRGMGEDFPPFRRLRQF